MASCKYTANNIKMLPKTPLLFQTYKEDNAFPYTLVYNSHNRKDTDKEKKKQV